MEDLPGTSATDQNPEEVSEAANGENKSTCSSLTSMKSLDIMKLNDHKAGMQGLDTAKINQIIEEVSKGSKFYNHKQKAQQRINKRVAEMKATCAALTEEQKKQALKKMDALVQQLELTRDLTKTIVHVDMDAFYAAVEMRDNPDLRDKPMAVGGMSMLSTSNYLARRYGVRAAMPGFIAKKLCPDLIIVPTNFPKYTAVSKQVQEIFAEYDPNFSAMSLDEAYLDLTEYLEKARESGSQVSAAEIVDEMRRKISEKTQLTASAGIAPNTMLAKVCSDQNKPNGQFVLEPNVELIQQFVDKLPIRKVSGIGNVTEQLLGALDIVTCKDLYEKRDLLYLLFSETSYDFFLRISLGLGSNMSGWTDRERKSMSCETTFNAVSDKNQLLKICEDLSEELSDDLQSHRLLGKAVTLKWKTDTFDVKTRIMQLNDYTSDFSIIATSAKKILLAEIQSKTDKPLVLRLLGVRMSQLCAQDSGQRSKRQRTLDNLFEQKQQSVTNDAQAAESSYTCPVCNNWKTTSDSELNRHIDECLNVQALQTLQHEEVGLVINPTAKKKGQMKLDMFIKKK